MILVKVVHSPIERLQVLARDDVLTHIPALVATRAHCVDYRRLEQHVLWMHAIVGGAYVTRLHVPDRRPAVDDSRLHSCGNHISLPAVCPSPAISKKECSIAP